MKLRFDNFAIIFTAPGVDPKVHRAVIKTDTITFTTIGVDSRHQAEVIEVAKQAVEDGAQNHRIVRRFRAYLDGKGH